MKGPNRFCFLLGLLVVFAAILPAFARDHAKGTLRVTVEDPQGAAVPGATVTVTNPKTGITRTATTCADGSYQVQALPGSYQVTVEGPGFAKKITKAIQISAGETLTYDAHLRVNTMVEIIEVTGDEVPLYAPGARLLYIDTAGSKLNGSAKKDVVPSR